MAGVRNTRAANRERWRSHIEAWRGSGLTQQAYCAREGLTVASLQRWRRIFREEAAGSPAAPVPKGLIPVRLVSESPSGSGLVLVVSDALRIEVAPGFDGATLRQLVAALGR